MGGYIGARAGTISATVANVQDVTATDTTPEVTIVNTTHEDTDGGREGKVIFKGQQSGGEETTLAEIQGSHDGTADDEKGDLIFKTNDGSDGASPTEAMRIQSDQKIGVGLSSNISSQLHVNSEVSLGPDNNNRMIVGSTSGGVGSIGTIEGGTASFSTMTFKGGDVGIGTSAPDGQLHLFTSDASITPDADADDFIIEANGASGLTIGSSASSVGSIRFADSGSPRAGMIYYDHVGNAMRFYTNATERARISSLGKFGVGVDPSYYLHVYGDVNLDFVSEIRNTGSNGPYGQVIRFSNAASDDNVRHFAYYTDNAAVRFIVDSDGDVRNHDNSYGSLSDQRIKENISDASSQWDDIKALKVRKFKFKDDVRQYGDDAKFKLGLVAQEAELVSPNLIQEASATPNNILSSSEFGTLYEDGDDIPDGKEVGDVKERKTTVKGVRYSILYMKAVKALQEAMARIETLETKVAALEAE